MLYLYPAVIDKSALLKLTITLYYVPSTRESCIYYRTLVLRTPKNRWFLVKLFNVEIIQKKEALYGFMWEPLFSDSLMFLYPAPES